MQNNGVDVSGAKRKNSFSVDHRALGECNYFQMRFIGGLCDLFWQYRHFLLLIIYCWDVTHFYRHLYSGTQDPAKLVVSLLAFIWIHLHANCARLADTKHRWDFTEQDSVQKNHNIQAYQTASRLNQPHIYHSVTILLQSHNYVIITEQSRWEKSC